MSRKNVISLDLFKDASASMAGDLTSKEVFVRELDKASIHCKWVAGPVGEFQVQAQNNDSDSWFTLVSGAAWAIGGSDSEAQIILNELPFTKIRLKYVRTSGTGTLAAFLTSKSTGA